MAFFNKTTIRREATLASGFSNVEKRVHPCAGLAQIAKKFLSETSAHGLPQIVSSRNYFKKFCWLIIFLCASGMFVYMMYGAVVMYLSKPVEISVSYKVRTEAEFPAVTICNLNPLKKSKLIGSKYQSLKKIDDDFLIALLSGLEKTRPVRNQPVVNNNHSAAVDQALQSKTASGITLENQAFMRNAASDTDFESFMTYSQTDDYSDLTDLLKPSRSDLDQYGHQIDDAILQCSFDKTQCSYLNFTKAYNNRYGNCYVFNINGTTTSLYGSRYGLRITLNVEPNDYVGLFSHEVGFRVAVHASNVTGFPEDEGVNAATQFATSIGVKTLTFNRLPHPYKSNCSDGSDDKLLDSGQYTVWSCMSACLQHNLQSECGCIDTVTIPARSMCRLTNATEEICRQSVYASYNEGTLGCNCPAACTQVKYTTTVSTTQWPSNAYIPILWDRIGDDLQNLGFASVTLAKNNLARVHVYMEDLIVQHTEEYAAFTEEDLLANMGGYLGLFIGISACTMFEFFEFIVDAFIFLCFTAPSMACKQSERKILRRTNKIISVEPVKLQPPPPSILR